MACLTWAKTGGKTVAFVPTVIDLVIGPKANDGRTPHARFPPRNVAKSVKQNKRISTFAVVLDRIDKCQNVCVGRSGPRISRAQP